MRRDVDIPDVVALLPKNNAVRFQFSGLPRPEQSVQTPQSVPAVYLAQHVRRPPASRLQSMPLPIASKKLF